MIGCHYLLADRKCALFPLSHTRSAHLRFSTRAYVLGLRAHCSRYCHCIAHVPAPCKVFVFAKTEVHHGTAAYVQRITTHQALHLSPSVTDAHSASGLIRCLWEEVISHRSVHSVIPLPRCPPGRRKAIIRPRAVMQPFWANWRRRGSFRR